MMSTLAGWWQRLWSPLLASRPGGAFVRHALQPIDRLLLPLTGGRATISRLVFPTLMLTTRGAKSGLPRETPLIFFRDGPRIVLVASNFGGASHPAWYYNLRANPRAVVTFGGRAQPYLAREASGAEREALWRRAVALYGGYAVYQRRAGPRLIPVMILEPAEAA